MDVHLLHVLTRGSEVLARIEVAGILREVLADGGRHREARVGVDVDLADGALGGLAELRFRNADRVGKLAAELVDRVDLVLGNGGRAVKNDREAGELLLDGLENVESQRRRNELAVLVLRALFRGELVGAVAGADGDGERIAARLRGEFDHFLGLRVVRLGRGNLVLDSGENAEFRLDRDVMLVGIGDDLLRELDVLFEIEVRAVDHNGREAAVDAALAGFVAVAVVEMENDLGLLAAEFLGVLDGALGHITENRGVGVFARALGDLHDYGRLGFDRGLNDGLHLLHSVEVESGDGVAALYRLSEHFLGVDETKLLVADHFGFLLVYFSRLLRELIKVYQIWRFLSRHAR